MTLAQLKKAFTEELLAGGSAIVVLDARRAGVSVPPEHEGNASLALRFGRNLTPPIYYLEITDEALSASLKFGAVLWRCVVPWGALLAAQAEYGPIGFSWPEDGTAREVVLSEPAKPRGLKLVD